MQRPTAVSAATRLPAWAAVALTLAAPISILPAAGPPPADDAQIALHFDQDRYAVEAGAAYTVHVLISPPPPNGLFSYGLRLSFDPTAARAVGASAIAVPAPLAFNGPRANAPVTAVGPGFAAVKGTADFSDPTRPASTNALLASFLMTDLGGPASYELRLDLFNTLGPTEQIFVDGLGTVLDNSLVLGTAIVTRPGVLEIAAVSAVTFNRQTGLFDQTARVANLSTLAIPAFRLLVRSLPTSWQVWNAHGVTDGTPWLAHNSPLAAGQAVDLRVEFRVPDRNPQSQPAYEVEATLQPGESDPPSGDSFAIVPRDLLADGAFLLEFSSVSNRQYQIQYSHDLETWITVQPAITGNGSRLQWTDYGPPKTDSAPATDTNRYYRVFLLP